MAHFFWTVTTGKIVILLLVLPGYFLYVLFHTVEDSERNDGSPEKPYYMNKSLKKILGKKNKRTSDSE